MNHKLLAICALAALTAGLAGCDENTDNGLDCSDGAYRAQCVDSKYMMYCDTTSKTEKVKVCEGGYVCADVNGIADCVDPNAKNDTTVCTDGAVQCNGAYVQTCVNNAWQNAQTPCVNGCENGACKPAPVVVPDCTDGAKQCNSDNSNTQTCTNGSWVDDVPACENGCENGVCKDAPVACQDGAKQCNADNSNVQTCTDGAWVDDVPACNFGCENGVCKEPPAETCEEDGAKRCNINNSNTQTCTDGVWVDDDPGCSYGCENDACKEPPAETDCEEESAVRCAEDTVQTCTDGKWTNADSACEFGCLEGACKEDPANSCTEEGAVQCAEATVQTCTNGKWVSADAACEFGCAEGKCNPEPIAAVDPECTKDEDCAELGDGIVCINSVCAPSDMAAANANDPCDPSWYQDNYYEFCDADGNARFCGTDANDNVVVVIDECSDGCVMAFAEAGIIGQEDTYTAVCKNAKSADCTEINQAIPYCDDTTYASQNIAYNSTNVCLPTTEGGLVAMDMLIWGQYDMCDNGCNEAHTVCASPFSCVGSDVKYCEEGECNTYTCNEAILEGTTCVNMGDLNGGENCYLPCTPSENGNDVSICVDDSYYGLRSYTGQCLADVNNSGNYLVTSGYVSCANGCDETTGKCITLVDGEGEACPEDFEAHCTETGIAVTCNMEIDWSSFSVITSVAAEQCGGNTTCIEYSDSNGDPAAGCLTACTEEGSRTYSCDGNYSDYNVCTDVDGNGSLYEVYGGYTRCSNGCDATSGECIKLIPTEGDPCSTVDDPDNGVTAYEEHCEGEVVAYCSSGKVATTNCASVTGYSCKVLDIDSTSVADCFSEAEVCTDDGTSLQCTTDSYGDEYSALMGCFSANDGKKYSYEVESTECENGCDATTKECKKLISDEGDTCTVGVYVEHCENGVVAYCKSGKVAALECTSGSVCATADNDGVPYSDCVVSDEVCDPVGATNSYCEEYGYGMYYEGHQLCLAFDDGKNHYILNDYDWCDAACNTEGTACATE